MSVESLRRLRDRLLASRTTWWALQLLYVLVVLIVLAPVLFGSVGADDSYWIMEKGPRAHGSLWEAWWTPVSRAFDFDFQPRTTALALSERQVLALVTMKIATTLSIPPMFVWASVKVVLLILSVLAVVAFLRQLTFRDRAGNLRGIDRSSIAFIAIALPLAIAIGSKAQNVNSLNGWNFYPTLTYGTFVGYFLFAALVLKLSLLLQRSYRVWVVPVVLLMAVSGFIINLSYELLALTIPITVLVLALQPFPAEATFVRRWRAKTTVLLALLIPYTAMFVWIRWRISNMACQATDSCYSGSVIEIKPKAVLYNFLGAFPGNNGAFVADQADAAHRPFPSAGPASVAIGVLGALALWAVWSTWQARQLPRDVADDSADSAGTDARGLFVVLALALSIALGSAAITGITARAVEDLDTPMLAYRSGVTTWSALALSGLVVVRLLMLVRWRLVQVAALAALAIVLIGAIGLYLPRNILTAQENRREVKVQFVDGLHRELSLGDASKAGDERRCTALKAELDRRGHVGEGSFRRTLAAAVASFEFYHHRPFCSTFDRIPE